MVGSLWTGISGLSGSQTALDNESNNIANVNTIGYKSSRISFTDQMYQAKIGKGVTSFDVEKMYTQGNLKLTGVSYDMALSGDGFFVASNGSETFYSRAGNFRMGESGKLEDVAQNSIQGWAMQPIQEDNIVSTDPNATRFTEDFSKLLGNKIIKDTTSIETVIAKATDYTSTAVSDVQSVYTGSGYKTASTKIADVELLITEYNALLTTHANANPKPTSSTSSVQQNYLNFNLDTVSMGQGDEMYVYIDGKKYSQSFVDDETTTMKKFVDQLSNTAGFKAHYTDGIENNPTGTIKEGAYAFDNAADANPKGGVYLESIIPGSQFRITEFGWTDASNSNQAIKGEVKTIQTAVMGTGMGAIESVEDALAQAVSGKQQDVYSAEEIMLDTSTTHEVFTYTVDATTDIDGTGSKITFDGVDVALADNDTENEVAAKLALATFPNWTATVAANVVTFTAKTDGNKTDTSASDFVFTDGDANADTTAAGVIATTDGGLPAGYVNNDFSYQINIYDNDSKTNKTIPAEALDMSDMEDIDAMVEAINTVADIAGKAVNTELAYYVKAFNINGNLVVKTLDSNNDVEFTGELKGPIPEQQTVKISGTAALKEHQTMPITGTVSDGTATTDFLETTIAANTFTTGDSAEVVIDWIIANKTTVITDYNADAANDDIREIEDIVKTDAGNIEIIYKQGQPGASADGNLVNIGAAAADNGITQEASAATVEGDLNLTFLGHNVSNISDADSTSAIVEKIISDKGNIISTWNSDVNNKEISNIIRLSSDEVKIIYKNTEGNAGTVASTTDAGITFSDSEELIQGELKGLIAKNANYSNREGAGAEFLKISSTINQTASKSDLQLRLDTLALTDSAFGDFSVDKTGLITMKQDGVDFAIGQIAVARFTDNRGLDPMGDNLYKATNRSGSALFKVNNYDTSAIKGGTLELSTADLSESLVNLMVFQRAFEANAKSITTADQILTTLIQLKR